MNHFVNWLRNLSSTKLISFKRWARSSRPTVTVELLERRQQLAASLTATFGVADGLLRIEGTPRDDRIAVLVNQDQISVLGTDISLIGRGSTVPSLPLTEVQRVEVYGLGGDDLLTFEVRSPNAQNLPLLPVLLDGGDGNDTLMVTDGSDVTVVGGAGNDTLAATGGTDVSLVGGDGNDSLMATDGSDVTLVGGDGNDTLALMGGTDGSLVGGDGNDSLVAVNARRFWMYGGDGNDTLIAIGGSDFSMFGGDGHDSLFATNGRGS
jgi:Ca2+-binding RTX toxin-like protein